MKRRPLAAVAAMLAVVLTACGSDGSDDAADASEAADASDVTDDTDSSDGSDAATDGEHTTLTVTVWNLDGTPEFNALFDAFEAANPDVTIEPVDILADDYAEKLTTMLSGGDSTDVLTMKNVTDYARYASRGQLADITDLATSDVAADLAGLDAFDQDGTYYALPYRQDFWLLFYNRTIFEEAGVDAPADLTWDEYAEVAKQLTSGEGQDQVYGTYHHVWRSVIQAIAAAQTGGDQLSGNYDYFADQYEMARELQDAGATLDFGTAVTQQTGYRDMFETGKTAMLPMGTWFIAALRQSAEEGATDADWALAPMPQRDDASETITFGSPTAFAVNTNAAHPEVAKRFIEFATGPEGAQAIANIGVVPALQSDEITESYFSIDGMPDDDLSKRAFNPDSVMLEMPVSDITSNVDRVLGEEHELIMVGESSIQEGLAQMAERVQNEVLQ